MDERYLVRLTEEAFVPGKYFHPVDFRELAECIKHDFDKGLLKPLYSMDGKSGLIIIRTSDKKMVAQKISNITKFFDDIEEKVRKQDIEMMQIDVNFENQGFCFQAKKNECMLAYRNFGKLKNTASHLFLTPEEYFMN